MYDFLDYQVYNEVFSSPTQVSKKEEKKEEKKAEIPVKKQTKKAKSKPEEVIIENAQEEILAEPKTETEEK